jgi:hypothetical protein
MEWQQNRTPREISPFAFNPRGPEMFRSDSAKMSVAPVPLNQSQYETI